MHLKSDDIIRLVIDFDSGAVPAPFSHVFKLKLNFDKNFINTQFEIQYTDRDDLSEEEILNEGFSLEDDYNFIGELPQVWEQPFKTLYSQTKWSNKKSPDLSGGIKVMAKDLHGKIARTVPLNQKDWQYLTQEYIQAIYEIDQKEAPLQIGYKIISADGQETQLGFKVKFSNRKIDFYSGEEKKEVAWEEVKPLLNYIFIPDYNYELASESPPRKPGTYIDCGDGFWHEFGKGVINVNDSFDAISKIKAEFMRLNQL